MRQTSARRMVHTLVWTAGMAVIALALAAALAQALLPLLARHPHWVAHALSEKFKRPVSFAALEGHWEPSGPDFIMHDVVLGSDAAGGMAVHVPELKLKLDLGGWLLPSRHLLNLEASDLALNITHEPDGRWYVDGLGAIGGAERQPMAWGHLSIALWLNHLRINIHDRMLKHDYALLVDQLRLTHRGNHTHAGARVHRVGVAGVLTVAGRFDDDGASGKFWVATQNADLRGLLADLPLSGYVLDSGHGDLAVWMDWRHRQIVKNVLELNLRDLAVSHGTDANAEVAMLHGVAELSRHGNGYAVLWTDHDGGALRADVAYLGTPKSEIRLLASQLQLAPLLPWLSLKPGLSPGLARWLGTGRPHGQIAHAVFQWSAAAGLKTLDAAFAQLGLAAVGRLPGLDRLKGELRGDVQAVSLWLPPQTTTLHWPHTFRKPFALRQLSGSLAAWRDGDRVRIGIAQLAFEGEGYGGSAHGEVRLPGAGGPPFLDLYLALTHANVTAAKLFWPIDALQPHVLEWLDQAFVSGRIEDAAVLIRGSLADWPFHHHEGRFEARAKVADLILSYGKGWPLAERIQAVAHFIDAGMQVEATGQSLGVKAQRAVAAIPDLGHATLDLNVEGAGAAPDLLNFVSHSPIGNKHADVLAKLKLGGAGTFGFHLTLPMKDKRGLLLEGRARLNGVDVSAPEWKLELTKLRGPASFDAHGFRAGPLDGRFHGEPTRGTLAIARATGNPDVILNARLDGRYTVATLLQDYPQLQWLGNIADGRSQFSIRYRLARADAGASDTQTLSIHSPLSGVALRFPAPLSKSADSTLPMHVTLGIPTPGAQLKLALGSVARGRLRLSGGDNAPLAAAFVLGDQMPDASMLPAKGIRIRGDAAQLDVTGWIKQSMAGNAAGQSISLDALDVNTDHAQLFGHDFGSMRVVGASKSDALELKVDNASVAGHVSVPTAGLNRRGITASLERLYWPKQPIPASQAENEAPPADLADTGIDPRRMPPLHIWARDLRLEAVKLGQARLETWPTLQGMHIDQLSTHSPSVEIGGSGDWTGTSAASSTHLRMDFGANNLGNMLDAFGYADIVEGGKTQAHLNATWPGGPWAFDLGNMQGTLGINIRNGSILKASPGVGRLFGLASIAELPRRLSLNFDDVFGKGFGFDSIKGDFKLNHGSAYTDNLKVRGPAAEITIVGRTDLRHRKYDQQMIVAPHVGSSLPIVGAVVGGPIGVVAGLAAQTVLGKGLNRAIVQRYHITGSWDKPVVTAVGGNISSSNAPISSASAPAPATSAGR